MQIIHESNTINCPNCQKELSAYDFDWLTQEAIDKDETQSCIDENCPHCDAQIAIEIHTYTTANISLMSKLGIENYCLEKGIFIESEAVRWDNENNQQGQKP